MGVTKIDMADPAVSRDLKKIEILKTKYDLNKYEDVEKLYNLLITGGVRFETHIGNAFDDQVCELKDDFKAGRVKQPVAPVKGKNETRKIKKTKKNSSFDDMDENMKSLVKKEMRNMELRRTFIIVIITLVALTCIGYFAFYYYKLDKSEKRFNELALLKGSDALAGNSTENQTTVSANIISEDGSYVPPVLDEYLSLYNSNNKLIGWLTIDDTNIDYPVMQCDDNEYYLSYNFDSEADQTGALFLDAGCNVIKGNDNFIIYGHHLSSGKMFGDLEKYESQSYYEQHMYIRFDTIYATGLYQVMFAFRSRVYNEDEVVFKYYQFIDVNSEEEFISYMSEMEELSLYDTGVRAMYGDQLLTLSTCDYHEANGRFVVVAKKIG